VVLVVDDKRNMERLMSKVLRSDATVRTAESGGDALRLLASEPIAVVLCDLKMPDMDGIQVIEQLKAMQPHIEVVMLTGHGGHDTAWEAGRLQAFRYILKPHDFDDLINLVHEAADHRRRKMKKEFETRLAKLMTGSTSPRDIINDSEELRREYEQD